MANQALALGRSPPLVSLAFIAFAVVLALLDHFGLPPAVLGTALGGVVLLAATAIGVGASTMQASEYYLAGRRVPSFLNGVATATAAMSALVFLGLAGSYFRSGISAAAITAGWALGLLVLATGLAPYFRKSSAFGVVDFIGICYGGRPVRIAAVVVVIGALTAALTAAIAAASFVTVLLLGIPDDTALTLVAAAVLASALLGGLRAVTRTALVEYVVLAVGFLTPLVVISFQEYGQPFPPLAVGAAARDAALLVTASGRDLAAALSGDFSGGGAGGFAALASVLVLAAGVPALPHLLMRSGAARGADRARRSAAWALAAILVVMLAAPAYPALARLILLREVVDGPIESLPDWIFAFGNLGLVRICGVDAVSVDTILGACHAQAGFTGNLSAADLAISGDAIVLAGPSIFGLPYIASALLAAGALAAALAAAKAITFALASAIGHDLYAGAIDTRASAGRQLILTRLSAAFAIAIATWFTSAGHGTLALTPIAISLSAAGLFPALVLGVWWKRANATGALAGIIAGGLVTAVIIADHHLPGFLPFGRLGLDDLTAGIVGLPIGFIAAVGASLATEPPSEERQSIIDAIRRPGGTPFVQETESL